MKTIEKHRTTGIAVRLIALLALCLSVSAWTSCDGKPSGDERAAASTDGPSAIITTGDTLTDSALVAAADNGRTKGSATAPIWVVMISDFQCPYCRTFHDSTLHHVERDYVETGKVRLAMLNLPLPQHTHARTAATAAMCASAQGKFWQVADSIFRSQPVIATMTKVDALFDGFAQKEGVDMSRYAHCKQSRAIQQLIDSDISQASRSNVRSTPTFFVGQFLVEGAAPYQTFKGAIDTALVLAKKAKAP